MNLFDALTKLGEVAEVKKNQQHEKFLKACEAVDTLNVIKKAANGLEKSLPYSKRFGLVIHGTKGASNTHRR